jgi:hypothetical protein
MRIQYIEPLSRGISRARKELFHPLDFKKWFVVGFAAFLASLADVGFSVPSPNFGMGRRSKFDLEAVLYFPQRAWEWLTNHPGWAMVITISLFLFFIFMIVITWFSSRGKFMFLDNVVWGRSRIAAPWYEYRKEGNSFFAWNLLWVVLTTAIVLVYLFYCFLSLQALYESGRNARALILPAFLSGLGLVAITIVTSFAFILLRDFVVPIMYRDRITTWDALQRFIPLFFSQLFYFLGYGFFLLGVFLLIGFAIVLFGCVTCCVGFIVLMIPYINAVVLLPVSYTLRAFSVEFLEQFGPEYQVFPKPETNPPDSVPITV